MLKFERLEHDLASLGYFNRAKVTGGWLIIVSQDNEEGLETITSPAFIPDPNHEWEGSSLT